MIRNASSGRVGGGEWDAARSDAVDGATAPVDGAAAAGIDVVAVMGPGGGVPEAKHAADALAERLADGTRVVGLVRRRLPKTAGALKEVKPISSRV